MSTRSTITEETVAHKQACKQQLEVNLKDYNVRVGDKMYYSKNSRELVVIKVTKRQFKCRYADDNEHTKDTVLIFELSSTWYGPTLRGSKCSCTRRWNEKSRWLSGEYCTRNKAYLTVQSIRKASRRARKRKKHEEHLAKIAKREAEELAELKAAIAADGGELRILCKEQTDESLFALVELPPALTEQRIESHSRSGAWRRVLVHVRREKCTSYGLRSDDGSEYQYRCSYHMVTENNCSSTSSSEFDVDDLDSGLWAALRNCWAHW